MPWIAFEKERHELPPGELIVGGGLDAGWQIDHAALADRHFVLDTDERGTTVRAYSPEHLVTLNGRQLSAAEPRRLRHGDVVAAGVLHLRYLETEDANEPAPRSDAAGAPAAAHLIDVGRAVAYPLGTAVIGIGRDPGNIVVIDTPTASRLHAQVRREAGGWALHPIGSAGTMLNGQRVGTATLLDEGDEIEIAYTVLRFTRAALPPDIRLADATTRGSSMPTAEYEARRRPTLRRSTTFQTAELEAPRRSSWNRTHAIIALLVVLAVLYFVLG